MSEHTLEVYFDYASPFAYVGDARIDRELAQLPISIVRTPVYLRGFDIFKAGYPYSAAKSAYLARDLARCAERHGVPLGTPATMPVNGLYMLRAHVALTGTPELDAFRREAFRATWVDGANTSDPEVVVAIGERIGVDHHELAAAMGSASVKSELRANTERAIERGAFGVPAMFVDDELFWGQDRVDYVRARVERLTCGGAMMSDPDE
jgi:2-hydroxychromene-2-carboxylate isomerase